MTTLVNVKNTSQENTKRSASLKCTFKNTPWKIKKNNTCTRWGHNKARYFSIFGWKWDPQNDLRLWYLDSLLIWIYKEVSFFFHLEFSLIRGIPQYLKPLKQPQNFGLTKFQNFSKWQELSGWWGWEEKGKTASERPCDTRFFFFPGVVWEFYSSSLENLQHQIPPLSPGVQEFVAFANVSPPPPPTGYFSLILLFTLSFLAGES